MLAMLEANNDTGADQNGEKGSALPHGHSIKKWRVLQQRPLGNLAHSLIVKLLDVGFLHFSVSSLPDED